MGFIRITLGSGIAPAKDWSLGGTEHVEKMAIGLPWSLGRVKSDIDLDRKL